jgi:ParB/RepB/Spo0J family partition protein
MRDSELRWIELEKIRVPEWAIRTVMDEAELKELKDSIEARGQIEPIIVRLSSDGHYELISGYRRLQALKMLNAKEVEAKVVECTDEEAIALSIEENEKRAEEHPFDVARKVAYMHDVLGMSDEKIANKLGKGKSWVSMMLKINAITDEAKRVLAPKVKDIAKLYAIATINSPEKQLIAADYLVRGNPSREEVKDLAKQANPMPVEEFRAYCERLLKGEGEVQGEGAGGAGVFNMLNTSQAQVQPPAQGPQKDQEQRKGPETGECSLCGKVRKWEELSRLRICEDEHQDFHELIRRAREHGSRNTDRVLGMVIPILDLILDYPSDKWGEIAQSIAELVPYIRGLGVERVKEVVEEVKRRHATS